MKKAILFLFIYLIIQPTYASESSVYNFSWLDPDKEVFVLQNRTFRKDGHLFLHGGGGISTSNPFVNSINMQARFNYFFTEEFGFEVLYSKNTGEENGAADQVRTTATGSGAIPFRRITDSYMGGLIVWSPFYAKINTFNTIIYLDWMFSLGVAQLVELNNQLEFENQTNKTQTSETHMGGIWQTTIKFYMNQSWDMRFDLSGIHYKADFQDESGWNTNYDLSLSLGFKF